MGFTEWFPGIFNKPKPPERSADLTVLPRSVRDEILNTPDHSIGVTELRRLVRDGESRPTEFANAALYSLIKISSEDPELQREIVARAVSRLQGVEDDEQARAAVRDLVEEYLKQVPPHARMAAGKLKRLNLAGVRYWDEWYAARAERLAQDPRNVFIVGNSMFYGLSSFVRAFREAGKPLYVLEPGFIESAEEMRENGSTRLTNYQTGYVIYPDGQVRGLRHGFRRPENAVIIDDIRDTGKTEEKLRTYWTQDGSGAPAFEPLEDISSK